MRKWDQKWLDQLLDVQEIDLKIRKIEGEIQKLVLRSMREDPQLNKMKAELALVEDSLGVTQTQQEMYLSTLEDIRSAIKGLAANRTGAFKPRTRSSTEALKTEEQKLEVLITETAEQCDRLNKQTDGIRNKIDARSKEVQSSQQAPEAELRKYKTRVRRLTRQRTAAIKGVPQPLLRKYERLSTSRSGIGLTVMRNGVCDVCRMQMPTGIRFRLKMGEAISSCPACGRMVARIEYDPTAAAIDKSPAKVGAKSKRKEAKTVAKIRTAGAKSTVKRTPSAKKPATKKPVTQKPVSKAAAPKKSPTKKPTAKKPVKKKVTAKKSPTKKKAVKKLTAKKPPTKKKTVKKPAVKKPPTKKKAAKKPAIKKKAAKKKAAKSTKPKKSVSTKKPIPKKKTAKKKTAKKKTAKKKTAKKKTTKKKTAKHK